MGQETDSPRVKELIQCRGWQISNEYFIQIFQYKYFMGSQLGSFLLKIAPTCISTGLKLGTATAYQGKFTFYLALINFLQ